MVEIKNDALDVVSRLKEIDANYALFFNGERGAFELYIKENGRLGYQLSFPFSALDVRMVEHCRKTRVERAVELIKEIDEANAKRERDELAAAKKVFENRTEAYLLGKEGK